MIDFPIFLGVLSDTAISVIVTAVCGLISTVVLAWMQKSTQTSVDKSNTKLDDAVHKRAEVHDLVNSNFSQVTADVKSANERLESMQKLVDKLIDKIGRGNGETRALVAGTDKLGDKVETIAAVGEDTNVRVKTIEGEVVDNKREQDKASAEADSVKARVKKIEDQP